MTASEHPLSPLQESRRDWQSRESLAESMIPLIGRFLGSSNVANGVMLPEFYNQLVAMHGTIMIFLGVVPLSVGGFGNYLVPLQVGASDMAFPRLNMLSYWFMWPAFLLVGMSFFTPPYGAGAGWTSYPPLSVLREAAPDFAIAA